MKADYKNWVPKSMVNGLLAGTGGLAAAFVAADKYLEDKPKSLRIGTKIILGSGIAVCGASTVWSVIARKYFSYNGKRKLSKQIVEGTAEYIHIPEGGVGLDVGCGSGALTIACARNNPNARMIGVDRWGKEYASFSKKLCEKNAGAEGVLNTSFQNGDAVRLDFEDEMFDAVTSNYVYHNITGQNKQKLLLETLRVLKKGGTFAIHDIMSRSRYGDMDKFVEKLREDGYEEVKLIPTDQGKFMSKKEASLLMLTGSSLLVGRK